MKTIKHQEYDEVLVKIVRHLSLDGIDPEAVSQLNDKLREGYDVIDWKFEYPESYFLIARPRKRTRTRRKAKQND